ncbi:MAG TPA: R3H domain-containing nucleic acid-binding protein, partial [Fimbriimonas sp.]|nr:R3H domain-containing nucleic acid-binding protein [Fimbriimonas sp.]
GIQAVTLSDAEAQRRGTQKTVLERKAPPTFDVVIELLDYDRLAVHHNVMKTVDMILRGVPPRPEIRVRTGGAVEVVQNEQTAEIAEPGFNQKYPALARSTEVVPNGQPGKQHGALRAPTEDEAGRENLVRIFPYGIARTRLERAIREKHAPAYVTTDIGQADAIMAIRSTYQAKPRKLRDIAGRQVPTIVVKSNTFSQIAAALDDILRQSGEAVPQFENEAFEELQAAIETVMQSGKPFELAPAPAPVRKVQHQMAEARRMASESVGEEPNRRIRLLPTRL